MDGEEDGEEHGEVDGEAEPRRERGEKCPNLVSSFCGW